MVRLRPWVRLTLSLLPWLLLLLPPPLLHVAPHGGLNVHPSLLPAYRGPAPLFWRSDGRVCVLVGSHEERYQAPELWAVLDAQLAPLPPQIARALEDVSAGS